MTKNPYIGSSFNSFLEEESLLKDVDISVRQRVIVWQLNQAMSQKNLTKTDMAKAMKTTIACVNKLLDPNDTSVTLITIERAAAALGMTLKIELVEVNQENSCKNVT